MSTSFRHIDDIADDRVVDLSPDSIRARRRRTPSENELSSFTDFNIWSTRACISANAASCSDPMLAT